MPVASKPKRGRPPAAHTVAKKAKVTDPIMEKIEVISKIISDPECQLQDSHRGMLLGTLPYTLTVPNEERHEYQSQVAQMIGSVLSDYVAHCEQQVSEAKDNIPASADKAAETMKQVEDSAVKVSDQKEEITKCKGIILEDSNAVKAAEKSLETASKEVAEFDVNLQAIIAEKDNCSSIYNDSFIPLKADGTKAKDGASLLKKVEPVLKKLSTESSMLPALAPAFKKSAADRGTFDVMVVEGAERTFTDHLEKLQEEIDKADTTKAEKASAETDAQEALKVAMEKHAASKDELKAAQEELASLENKHADFLSACNAAAQTSEASKAVLASKESRLSEVQFAFTTFTELLERQAIQEPTADEMTVEDKHDMVCESSLTEPATVA